MQLSLIPFSPVRAQASPTPEVSDAHEGEPVAGDFFVLLEAALVPAFAPAAAPVSVASDTARPATEHTDNEQTAVWPATAEQYHFNFQTETIPESVASLSATAPLRSPVDTAIEKIDATPPTLLPSLAERTANSSTKLTAPEQMQPGQAAPALAPAEPPLATAPGLMPTIPQTRAAPIMAGTPAPSNLPIRNVLPRVGTIGWDHALSNQVVWLARSEYQSASLHVNPPELGPVHVVLSLSDAGTTASFTSAQPEVRLAIEAALPRLREMLGDAGLQLNNASVSSGQTEQRNQGSADASSDNAAYAASPPVQSNVPASGAPAMSIPSGSARGLVDTFA